MLNPIDLYHGVHLAFQLKGKERSVNDQLKPKGVSIKLPSDTNIWDFGHALLILVNDRTAQTFKTTESYRELAVELLVAYRYFRHSNEQVWGSNPVYVLSSWCACVFACMRIWVVYA